MRLLEVLIERNVHSLNRPFYYVYLGDKTVEKGFRVIVPFSNKDLVGYVIKSTLVNDEISILEQKMGFRLFEIKDVIDEKPLLNNELMELAEEISNYYCAPLIGVLQTMLPPSLKPSSSSLKGPKIAYDIYVKLISDDETSLTPKQIELIRKLKSSGEILKKECKSQTILDNLYKKNRIVFVKAERSRYVIPEAKRENTKILTKDQQNAVNSILNTDKTVSLLQGVTGSGKTEVYLSLSEKILSLGRNVLMLVPEISLTPIMIDYFNRRFEGKVAVLHSGLTAAEKYDEYRKIARGESSIVVGARSAIFAPLENIGLIIIDEEHVESYKQDVSPFYHAREIALLRAKYNNSKIVLGSATPSLESKARAMKGVYNLVSLNKRINNFDLPKTYVVDMSKGINVSRHSSIFSNFLLKNIQDNLIRNEQTILLINRRGYSGYITCRNCGHIFKCPNCDITLTYHREDDLLKCHHCGHVETKPDICPECGAKYFSRGGFGTEKIVEELKKIFPNARTLRLDSDVAEVKNNIRNVIETFSNHEADILVGTQMIAKGHDFPLVTLVGVVSADIGLSLPTFRSSERVFELITQAVGRCGRASKEGRAIIQTYNPNHYSIQLAAKQDYESFYKIEMGVRKIQQYPPYTFLISLELTSKNENRVITLSEKIAEEIRQENIKDLTLLGPTIPFLQQENGVFHRVILVKYKNSDKIKQYFDNLLDSLKGESQVNVKVNVDPYNF